MYQYIHIIGFLLAWTVWDTYNVAAQEVVLRGSAHRYSIAPASPNANYTYQWAVTGGTSSAFGNGSTSNLIVWDGPPGLYSLSVYPMEATTGCAGNTRHFKVKVIDFFIRWQGASTAVCSALGKDERDFSIVAEFTQTYEMWSFEYQIDDLTPIKVMVNGESTKIINISGLVNRSVSSLETHTARIIKVTTPEGSHFTFDGTEKDAFSHMHFVMIAPMPSVNLGRDTFICSPDHLLLDAGNPGMTYEWNNGSRTQTIWANEGDGLFWVKVTNDSNCSASDSISIKPCSPLNYLFVPNVFTPNDDGENDVWRIGGLQYFPGVVVKLFDRWGRQIFVSEPDYPKPWDGKRNGKLLPMDAYYYVIDLKDGSKPIRGSVTLIP